MGIAERIKSIYSSFLVILKEEHRKEMEALRLGIDIDAQEEYQDNNIFRYGPLDSAVNPYGIDNDAREYHERCSRQEDYYQHFNRYCR